MRLSILTTATAAALAMACGLAAVRGHAQDSLPQVLRSPVLAGPDRAQLDRGRSVYMLSGCHFCHGIDMGTARGGAADLKISQLLADDDNGNLIGAVVRTGFSHVQTSMPQFQDMTDNQVLDLAAYMHFLRERLAETTLKSPQAAGAGDAMAGASYFAGNCAACHKPTVGHALTGDALRDGIVRPAPAQQTAAASDVPGRKAHLKLLENYTVSDIQNLVAYLSNPSAVRGPVEAPVVPIQIWTLQHCAECHGDGLGGSKRAPALIGNPAVSSMNDEQVGAIIRDGLPTGMPAFHLPDAQVKRIIAYLRSRTADAPG